MTNKPIPRAAIPVMRLIRSTVRKPQKLPVLSGLEGEKSLRFFFPWSNDEYCPMGLLPSAADGTPTEVLETWNGKHPPASRTAIKLFWRWWDSLTDARSAVDAVWGRED